MASVNLDDICNACLKAEHCGGDESWCSCCNQEDIVGLVKRQRKMKARDGEWK